MEDIDAYRYALREICYINGLTPSAIVHIHYNPIAEDKMAKIYGRKGTSQRFSCAKLQSRKRNDVKCEETKNVNHYLSCEIFAIKLLARVRSRVK